MKPNDLVTLANAPIGEAPWVGAVAFTDMDAPLSVSVRRVGFPGVVTGLPRADLRHLTTDEILSEAANALVGSAVMSWSDTIDGDRRSPERDHDKLRIWLFHSGRFAVVGDGFRVIRTGYGMKGREQEVNACRDLLLYLCTEDGR